MKNRIEYDRVNPGEIILAFIRENLSGFTTINATESQTVLWFEISKTFTNLKKNLFLGIVYIPP